jgi:hypothetical protein
MTIHPRTTVYAWHCDHGCTGPRSAGSGYPSEAAAAKAERRHNEQLRHTAAPVLAGAR